MDGNLKFYAILWKKDFDLNCDVSDLKSFCMSLPFSSLEGTVSSHRQILIFVVYVTFFREKVWFLIYLL